MSELENILILILGFISGIGVGLCFCAKYRNIFMTRSKSISSFKDLNHQNVLYPNDAPVIQASAPPPTTFGPPKITIQ